MKSVVSYPSRGNYGKSSYRGNTSGYIIKDLIEHFSPKVFVDVCQGGGTSKDVAKELGVKYFGLDLHTGFDFTENSVLKAIGDVPADMVFSHPPYHDMINYHEERKKHGLNKSSFSGNDLSNCASVEEFLELSQRMLLNQREATRHGGIYTTLIGDMRKDGKFHSFQANFIEMMPKSELKSVVIKLQHNMMSNAKTYKGGFVPILHEYLLIWQRGTMTLVQVAYNKAKELQESMNTTWKNFVKMALINSGGKATLETIYKEIESVAGEKLKTNSHYQAKVRQTLQKHFTPVSRGVWQVA